MNNDSELKEVSNQLIMRCPKCNKKISELDEKCPYCGISFEDYEQQNPIEYETEENKTIFLKVINYIQLVIFIITGIINLSSGQMAIGSICIATGLVIFAFIKGFTDIIDLLNSINEKLK